MKKNLLNKMTKVASVALIAGAMVCGASLSTNANAAKVNNDAKAEKEMTQKGKLGTEAPKAGKKTAKVAKKGKKAVKKSLKKTAKKQAKKSSKKAVKKGSKKVTKKGKKLVKKAAKKSSKKASKKAALKKIKKHVAKPNNKKSYRHYVAKHANYRKTSYYHKVWSNALKVNKKAMNFDLKQAKKDQKAGYKKAAKNAMYYAKKANWWINHDEHMLGLAK